MGKLIIRKAYKSRPRRTVKLSELLFLKFNHLHRYWELIAYENFTIIKKFKLKKEAIKYFKDYLNKKAGE
jgi:hypothetical protein